MEGNNGGGASLIAKAAICLALTVIAAFFVVQASLGARDTVAGAAGEEAAGAGFALGEAIYGSLKGLLDGLTSSRVSYLTSTWSLATGGKAYLEEEGGVLYITSNQGQVMAVDAAAGSIIWSLDLGVWVSAPPAVQAGVVYVGATDHVLYALDAGSGALLWYYPSQGEILAQPVVDGEVVFFTADNDSVYDLVHRLYALDARSGTPIWIYDTESWTPSAPAVGEEAVYLGGYRREVYALDKRTGGELWSFKASNIVFSSPQVVADEVVFTCIDGWVHALDAASGVPLWSRKLPGFVWLAPPDGSRNLYACSHRDTLTALALDNGEELWSFSDSDLLSCTTLMEEDAVCAFNEEGIAYLLDAADGELFGILRAPQGFASPPLLVGGCIYVSSSDGFVNAYTISQEMR